MSGLDFRAIRIMYSRTIPITGGDLASTRVAKQSGHAEDQSPRKSIWNTTNANDERFALAA